MDTAGRAVAFSGTTVAVSLCGLFMFPHGVLRSVAVGGIAVTIATVILATTLLPALLALLGPRVDALHIPFGLPLPHEIDDAVADVARIPSVRDELAEPAGEVELLIELAQQHEPRVAGDLSALEINDNLPLESEPRSTMTLCSHRHPSAPAAGVALASASVADSKSVGGFLIHWFVNNPG